MRRYDGLRVLAHRIYDAYESTADSRGILAPVARGTAVAPTTVLVASMPWPDLIADATIFRTLAVVYRRQGPLTPRRHAWWRTRGRREATPLQIGAPLRRRNSAQRRRGDVTSIDQARAILDDMPELQSLSEPDRNNIAYRMLYPND